MAGIKISQLDSGGSVTSTDQLPVARDGATTYRIPANQFVVNATNSVSDSNAIGVYASASTGAGTTLNFRSIAGEEGLIVRESGNTIYISASGQNPAKTSFIGNNSTTTWAINEAKSVNPNNYRVTIDGVVQEPNVDYTINLANSTITFTSAPPLSGAVTVISNNLVRAYDVIPSDGSVTLEKLVTTLQQALLPAGAIQPFAMNVAPAGWLAANGAAVSRNDYAVLFAAIGTIYGAGNGSTTFNLPDLRGYFVRGAGTNSIDSTASGTFGAMQADDLKSHTHGITDPGHRHGWSAYNGPPGTNYGLNFVSGIASFAGYTAYYVDNSTTGITVSATGGTETRPRNIAMLYCIKT